MNPVGQSGLEQLNAQLRSLEANLQRRSLTDVMRSVVVDPMVRRLDADSDGALSRTEAQRIFDTAAAGGLKGADADARFAGLDTSGDGHLQRAELSADLLDTKTLGEILKEATGTTSSLDLRLRDDSLVAAARRKMFESLDRNGDRRLSAGEAAGMSADPAASAETWKSIVAAMDVSGDGKLTLKEADSDLSSLLTPGRMDAVLAQRAGGAPSQGPPLALATWMLAQGDEDQSGGLSLEELTALRGGQAPRLRPDGLAFNDTDASGEISAAELAQALDGDGARPVVRDVSVPALATAAYRRLDADKDGALNRGELDAAGRGGAFILGHFDRNKDMRLSREEMGAALGQRADFYRTGVVKTTPANAEALAPDAGERALAQLLWSQLGRMIDQAVGGGGGATTWRTV